MSDKQRSKAIMACATWNSAHPIGTAVQLRRDGGEIQSTRTCSEAYVCDSGYPVIFLDGVRGYYLLSRVEAQKP